MQPDQTKLLNACCNGDLESIQKYIADYPNKVDFVFVDQSNWSPLHYVVTSNSYECVDALLSTNFLDIGLQSHSGRTCLDVAIACSVSSDIIRLLLEHDPHFDLIKTDKFGFVYMSAELIETIIDTLQTMQFPFKNEYVLLNRLMTFLNFQTDAERSMNIFEKLIDLVLDEATDGFMQKMCELFFGHIEETSDHLLKWCIEKFHLSANNGHRELVQKLLNNPHFGFDSIVIFGLHSDIDFHTAGFASVMFCLGVIEGLHKIDVSVAGRDVIDEVGEVLWPKMNVDQFSFVFYYHLGLEKQQNHETVDRLTSVKWLDTMGVGERLDIDLMPIFCASNFKMMLNALMPFSTKVTGDEHLKRVKDQYSIIHTGVERIAEEYRLINPDEEGALSIQSILHELQNQNRISDDYDEELGKFCAEGMYRAKSSLKSFCRMEIRKSLLQAMDNNKSHSQLVKRIQSLGLPKSVQQFLMFNYSEHEF